MDVSDEEWRKRERALVRAARRGDRRAVAALYEAFAEPLFAQVLMPRLGHRQAAEDALAETFRTALERLATFDDRGLSIYFWLARIAMNKAMDQHRARSRSERALTRFEGLLGPLRPSGAEAPGARLEAEERRAALEAAVTQVLGRLNERYRRALTLRFLDERSRSDCAAALEVKIGTFDVLLLRALRAFRREWERAVGVDAREALA